MRKLLYTLSISLIIAACGGDGGNDVSSEAPPVAAALPEPTDTDELEVNEEFSFNTARTVTIAFDIEAARDKEASVSICTEYASVSAFDIDYESCAVRSKMTDGVFNHTMELTNAYNSVIGVVWFEDESIDPITREFFVDEVPQSRSKAGVAASRTLVWK